MTIMGFTFLILATLGNLFNLISGFQLSQQPSSLDQWHLISAILSIILACVGCILLIRSSEKIWDNGLRNKSWEESTSRRLLDRKQSAFSFSVAIFALTVLSLITGSLAHGGEWPLIHSILGIALLALLLLTLWKWRLYFSLAFSSR